MAEKSKKKSLFAMLFSDLMMGAMGVIIVLLIFLSVVAIRGIGQFEVIDIVELPPGLNEKGAEPLVRIRVFGCNVEALDTLYLEPYNLKAPAISKQPNGCLTYHWIFPKGIGNGVEFVSKKNLNTNETFYINATVAGYMIPTLEVSNDVKAKQIIATLDLADPDILYVPES